MSFASRWPLLVASGSVAAFLVHCTGGDPEPATALPDSGSDVAQQPETSTSDGAIQDAGPPHRC